jgi:hypothetical protein
MYKSVILANTNNYLLPQKKLAFFGTPGIEVHNHIFTPCTILTQLGRTQSASVIA